MTAPLPSLGTVVEVFGPDPGSARWDVTTWDEPDHGWDLADWRDVTGLAMSADLQWGADRQVGVLSVASAGRLSIRSYDPLRLLDPSNTASPYWAVLRPGTPVRLRYVPPGPSVALVNPSFEASGMAGWTAAGPAAGSGRTTVAGTPDGSYAATIIGGAAYPYYRQVFDAPTEGGTYVLQGWGLRVTGSGYPATIGLVARSAAGIVDQAWAATNATDTWQALTVSYTVPRGAGVVSLEVQVRINAATTAATDVVRFDAMSLVGPGAFVIRAGWLDTISYSHADRTGDWRASDAIPLLVQARTVVAATGVPTTLRALARYLVARTGVPVTVEPDPEDGDPVIGATPPANTDGTMGVWDWVLIAAADVLRAAWVDHDNVLRFRPYGDPRDLGLAIGGADGIPMEDLVPTADLDAVFNVVAAKVTDTTWTEARDGDSVLRYGERRLDRDRVTPGAPWWVANVLADRAEASLDYAPRTLRLRDAGDLEALVTAGMVDTVRVDVESATPPVEVSAALLGVSLAVDPESGWSGDVVAYVPSSSWDDAYTPPPVIPPIDPTPPPTVRVTRSYTCTKDTRSHRTSGGAEYGSGTEGQLPVGYWSGSKNRAALAFATIPWGGVVKVVSARLLVTTSTQVNVGFGSSPKVEARRITEGWSEGSSSSPSGSNATVWPGPSTTTTGAKQSSIVTSESNREAIDVSAIVRAWAPKAAGGSAAGIYGIALYSAAESSGTYTTEFLSRETGSSGSRPVLELTLDVLA